MIACRCHSGLEVKPTLLKYASIKLHTTDILYIFIYFGMQPDMVDFTFLGKTTMFHNVSNTQT